MASTTTQFGLPYPEGADPPDGAAQMRALAEAVDSGMVYVYRGAASFNASGVWNHVHGRGRPARAVIANYVSGSSRITFTCGATDSNAVNIVAWTGDTTKYVGGVADLQLLVVF